MDSTYERLVPDYSEYRNRRVPGEPLTVPAVAPAVVPPLTK
jgi:hypothetical protein